MGRQSRTFKLRLSPAGMDLLIDSHCYLIRSTRALLAWGTTLHVAVECLERVPTPALLEHLSRLPQAGFCGSEEHHLGAPRSLSDTVARISHRVSSAVPARDKPAIADIYIAALQHLTRTDGETLRAAYERTRSAATPDDRKISH